ncbi:hypothetical protein, partial [uncultured Nostoc sp.]|uniref:hypothetical protein n=1 Tax=uncultured Nostoc sp. TaxID=340711 RepID=UPI0035CB3685
RSVLPELWGFLRSSGLLGERKPLDPQLVFIRSLGEIDCSVRCSRFNYWIPWTLAVILCKCGGNNLQ